MNSYLKTNIMLKGEFDLLFSLLVCACVGVFVLVYLCVCLYV